MKKVLIISLRLTMLAVIFGCNSNSAIYSKLIDADTLIHKNEPDSAYLLLSKIKQNTKSERDKAYYGLLLTRTMYMKYNPLKSDSLVSASVEYYKKTGETNKLADAYLAKGKNLYYRGHIKQAVLCAKECEKLAENINNLSLKNELYRFLAQINSRDGECKIALKYAKKALAIAETNNKWAWKGSSYTRMAIVYAKLGDTDSACYYISKCIPF